MNKPWWRTWPVKELSPLNPEAVMAAQLDPPIIDAYWRIWKIDSRRYFQIWWLQWYARPDLRVIQLSFWCLALGWGVVKIHPSTVMEWREAPRWPDEERRAAEARQRSRALAAIAMPIAWTAGLSPIHWQFGALPFQASRSRRHGDVLAVHIQDLPLQELLLCLDYYQHCRPRMFSRVFATAVLQAAETIDTRQAAKRTLYERIQS